MKYKALFYFIFSSVTIAPNAEKIVKINIRHTHPEATSPAHSSALKTGTETAVYTRAVIIPHTAAAATLLIKRAPPQP